MLQSITFTTTGETTSDFSIDDSDFSTWGIAITQKVAKLGAEFYLAYRHHDLNAKVEGSHSNGISVSGSDFDDIDDINTFMLGARIKF